ncbi:MAG: thioester domain-containing protein, partial [Clostridia bacterium]|nr:thioester domain-containing protein [Clostridia bacterium]
MKTNQLRTRVLAALLAVVLVVGTGVAGLTALAAQTVTVQIANIPRSGDNQYSNNNWGHPELKLMNGWTVHVETYFTVKILDDYDTGNAVYCLEPPSSLHTGDTLSQQGDTVNFFRSKFPWNGTLSGEWQRKLIAAILYHGYHGTCNLKTWVTQNSGGRAQLAKYWATQLLIWESIIGERDPNFNRLPVPNGSVSVDGFVTNGNPIRSDIYNQMADIEKKVKAELLCPSFVNQNGGLA